MLNTKKLIGAAAFTVALAGGGVAGAILGVPGTSGAQESTTTTAPADSTTPTPADGPGFGHGFRHELRMGGLTAAADALGMTEDELRTELQAGKTIAAVAGEKNVDVQTVIDAMVAEATADITEHITDLVNNGFPDKDGDRGEKLDAVATALGITPEELRTEIESGKSIADVAGEQNVDVQTVIDALVAAGVPADRADDIVNHAGPFMHRDHGPRP